jgi:hypothetical protein
MSRPQPQEQIYTREASGGIATRILSGGEITLDPPGISLMLEAFYAAG